VKHFLINKLGVFLCLAGVNPAYHPIYWEETDLCKEEPARVLRPVFVGESSFDVEEVTCLTCLSIIDQVVYCHRNPGPIEVGAMDAALRREGEGR